MRVMNKHLCILKSPKREGLFGEGGEIEIEKDRISKRTSYNQKDFWQKLWQYTNIFS